MPEHPRNDEGDSDFERGLPGALRAVSHDFPGPSTDLIARGHRRGRRLRRVRGIQVGVSVAALVAVALGGAYAVVGLDDDGSVPVAGAASTAPVTPGTSAPPAHVSAADMLANLKSVLPPGGSYSDETSRGTEPEAGQPRRDASAKLLYRNTKGASGVAVTIGGHTEAPVCPPPQVAPHVRCSSETLPDGSTVATVQNFTYPSKNTGQKDWYVQVFRPNSVLVTVHVYGGGGEKETSSPVDPILTTDQIKAVATSDTWGPAIAAVGSGLPPATPPPAQGTSEILGLLKMFAPPGAAISDEFAQTGNASFIVDDGKGRSALGVNVQRDMTAALGPAHNCEALGRESTFCEAETLADGTRVLLLKRPSEKGGDAVVWTADLLRPDGFRVVASSINSYAEAAEPTRTAPALDLAQLRELVTDQRWLSV
ncbi:hypothetical protein [Yinghuangia sp. YIM S09857]|uniref:hypothetical protein n=1 Tax=Yinghuangia sp. YIM S09857 TaxID=3436929 RepID=UPI003F532351